MSYSELSDSELVALLKDDDDVFYHIYQRHWHSLYQVSWRRVKDSEQAKDIVQEIFTSLWTRRKTVNIECLEAWLKTAVKYKIYKLIAQDKASEAVYKFLRDPAFSHENADELILKKEFNIALVRVIEELPEKNKKIFKLKYVNNLSSSEIAAKLNIPRKTVQNHLTKAYHSINISLKHFVLILNLLILGRL